MSGRLKGLLLILVGELQFLFVTLGGSAADPITAEIQSTALMAGTGLVIVGVLVLMVADASDAVHGR